MFKGYWFLTPIPKKFFWKIKNNFLLRFSKFYSSEKLIVNYNISNKNNSFNNFFHKISENPGLFRKWYIKYIILCVKISDSNNKKTFFTNTIFQFCTTPLLFSKTFIIKSLTLSVSKNELKKNFLLVLGISNSIWDFIQQNVFIGNSLGFNSCKTLRSFFFPLNTTIYLKTFINK